MQSGSSTLVIAGSPILAYNASVCLAVAGHRVDVMGTWRFSPYRFSRFWRRYTRVDYRDFRAGAAHLADQINRICEKRAIDFVIPGCELSTSLVLRHSDRIRNSQIYPTPGFELFSRLTNKWTFSQVIKECAVPHPATELLGGPDEVDGLKIGYPLIVKPLAESGAREVYVVPSADDLRRYAVRCRESGGLPLLVQQYVEGRDIDLTLLANHGRLVAWTVQQRHPGGEFRFLRDFKLLDLGLRIVEHTKYHGVIDFDLRRNETSGAVWMIEANARLPGTLRYKLWAGVNFPDLALRIANDSDSNWTFAPPEGSCINYGVSPKHLLRGLVRGRVTPPGWSPYTTTAWRQNLSDAIPHALVWFGDKLQRRPRRPPDSAMPLPS